MAQGIPQENVLKTRLEGSRLRQIALKLPNPPSPPSESYYRNLYLLAAIGDLADLLVILGWLVDFIIDPILLIASWRLKERLEKMQKSSQEVDQVSESLRARIKERRASRTSGNRPSGPAPKAKRAGTKVKSRNPFSKSLWGILIDLIPIAQFLPFKLYSVWQMKKAETETYQEIMATRNEAQEAQQEAQESELEAEEEEAQWSVAA